MPVNLPMFESTLGGRTALAVSQPLNVLFIYHANSLRIYQITVFKTKLKSLFDLSFLFSLIKDLTVQPTATMSCVVLTVATPVPAALMPPVSRCAPRDVSVTKALSGVGQAVSQWKDVGAYTMASTTM